MEWKKYSVGTVVKCGLCLMEVTVKTVKGYDGGIGFELSCGHRNGYCINCDLLVKDTSESPTAVNPSCRSCISQARR